MRTRAFTLVELILVVAIMATLAGTVVVMAEGTHDRVDRDLRMREMYAIRQALLQFQLDTGFFPGEGPFDHRNGHVPVGAFTEQWHDTAVNVWQLIRNPLEGGSHPLATWDPDRQRGWRGPYLTTSGEGQVFVPFIDGRSAPSSIDPGAGTPLSEPMPAIADPALRPVAPPGSPFHWVTHYPPFQPLASQGRPYLIYLPRAASGAVIRGPDSEAQVRCMGDDGLISTMAGTDDLTVYLFR